MDISFVIITGGSKPKHVDRLLKSIKKQNIKNFESIVVGNTKDLNIDLFSRIMSGKVKLKTSIFLVIDFVGKFSGNFFAEAFTSLCQFFSFVK